MANDEITARDLSKAETAFFFDHDFYVKGSDEPFGQIRKVTAVSINSFHVNLIQFGTVIESEMITDMNTVLTLKQKVA